MDEIADFNTNLGYDSKALKSSSSGRLMKASSFEDLGVFPSVK